MNHIHKVIYVNLEKRPDRRAEIESEFVKLGISGERFVAIEHKLGIVGCGLSHLAILKRARDEGWPNVMIFEDDFEAVVDVTTFHAILTNFFETIHDWDALMFAYGLQEGRPYNDTFGYVTKASTTAGYIVHQRMYDSLIHIWEEAIPKLEQTGEHWNYALDQVWKALQPTSQWFYTMNRMGKQRGSYSDISYVFMDRGV
jgi:hypothetical protein